MTRKPDRQTETGRPAQTPRMQANCEKIRELLTAFVANELGDAQSSLIREHLRQCDSCREAAQQIRQTFALLRHAGQMPSNIPEKLSDDRHSRIMRAYAQPLLTWLRMNLIPLISILIAVAVLAALAHTLVMTSQKPSEFIETGSIIVRLPYNGPADEPLEAIFTNADADTTSNLLPSLPEAPISTPEQKSPPLPVKMQPEDN
ncbi:MAG: zf-HC2 domain-containing protein [bacterium]